MSDRRIDWEDGGWLQAIIKLITRIWQFIVSLFRPVVPVGPRIDSLMPSQGYPGTMLEINGANFSANRSDNDVKVGGEEAWVVEASATRLKVITGVKTNTGPVEVTVNGQTGKGPHDFEVELYPTPNSLDDGPPILYLGAGKGVASHLPSKGTIHLLVIPCYPTDRKPADLAKVRNDIANAFNNQVRTYYQQVSYAALDILVTEADWHQFSGNYMDYVDLSAENFATNALPRMWAEAAKAAKTGGHKLDDFEMMAVVLFGNGQWLHGLAGPLPQSSFSYKDKTLDINESVGHPVWLLAVSETAEWSRSAHEIGHNLLEGNPTLVLYEDVYINVPDDLDVVATADNFDLMGSSGFHPLFTGFYMQQLDYYSKANIVELDWDRNPFPAPGQPPHEYEIVAHGHTQNNNPNRCHLVRIKVTNGLYYYIEVRQKPDPNLKPVLLFDDELSEDDMGPSKGGVLVTKVFTSTINMNQEIRFITLLHDAHLLKTGDTATDPLRSIKITVVDDNVVARPLVCRVRVEWAQTITPDPKGKFDLQVRAWDSCYQSDDIWIDREPWGQFDHHDAAGNPVGNGDKPRVNKINHFWGRVYNSGTEEAKNVRLTFYSVQPPGVGDNGNWAPLGTKTIKSIAVNDYGKDVLNWTPKVGEHTCLKIVAEPQLGETNMGNNSAQENIFEFEAAASSVPDPLIIPIAVRNPLKERTIALLSLRGLPEGFIAQLPHSWVWLDPLQERLMDVTVVPLYDIAMYRRKEIPKANLKVDGRIPHHYQREVAPGDIPASVLWPMGGILAQITPKRHGEIELSEDPEFREPRRAGVQGQVTPAIAGQPVSVELTDPHNRLRVQQVFTNATGKFSAIFDLTRAPSEDPEGLEPGEEEQPMPGDYRAQAVIVNALDIAECESNVVHLRK